MKLIGIMNVFNEADILEENLNYLYEQNIELILVDNCSTDGSYDIAKNFLDRNIVKLCKYANSKFSLTKLIEYDLYLINIMDPDWTIWIDADEFLEPPHKNVTLKEAIQAEAKQGYNMIQFNSFQFMPTEKDPIESDSIRKKIRYYSWIFDYHFKAWKWHHGTKYNAHKPIFPNNIVPKISPVKFVLRHYPIRSYEQGLRKVFEERINRFDKEEKSKGISVHYDHFTRDKKFFIIDSKKLTKYNEDGKWNYKKKYDIYNPKIHMYNDFTLKTRSQIMSKIKIKIAAFYDRNKALEKLLKIYNARQDLQKKYPEVMAGRYENLINWATSITRGKYEDDSRYELMPHAKWYKALTDPKEWIMEKVKHLKIW